MNLTNIMKVSAILAVTLLGISSCGKDNSAESAGKSIDTAVEKTKTEVKSDSRKVVGYLDDSTITAKIKTVLLSEPGLESFEIDVETSKGITTLNGTVDSSKRKYDVENLVASIEGVKKVNNSLVIKKNQ